MDERPFWFHPDANAEVLSAHDRYAEVTLELAERFQEELERSRQAIARNPLTWPAHLCGTQRYLLKSFPYFIVFRVTEIRIEIPDPLPEFVQFLDSSCLAAAQVSTFPSCFTAWLGGELEVVGRMHINVPSPANIIADLPANTRPRLFAESKFLRVQLH